MVALDRHEGTLHGLKFESRLNGVEKTLLRFDSHSQLPVVRAIEIHA